MCDFKSASDFRVPRAQLAQLAQLSEKPDRVIQANIAKSWRPACKSRVASRML